MNAVFQALAREAGLAAEHLAVGVSTLGKANYAQDGLYFQAFFDLAIGFERTSKLIILIDHYLANQQTFPTDKMLKDCGHSLEVLLEHTERIAQARNLVGKCGSLPRSPIHDGMIKTLTDFATRTRYYNLNYLTGAHADQSDPVKVWYTQVILPILDLHYTPRHEKRHSKNANMIAAMMDGIAVVQQHSESGDDLDTVYAGSMQTAKTKFAKPFCRMYLMQIMRFLGRLLSELSHASHRNGSQDIPYLSEFFAIFYSDDAYFKRRKTWSIYGLR